jgi:hypothetical protein
MPEQACLRYETTSEYDGKSDYDNFFIPAQISFFHNRANLVRKAALDKNFKARLKKNLIFKADRFGI